MADITINDEEVIENLSKIENGALLDALRGPLEKACLRVLADAKSNCPVGDGTLRNSIQYSVEDDGNNSLAGYVGSNLDYAPYVHQGTGIYAKNGDGRKEVPWIYYDEKHKEFRSTSGIKSTPFIQDAIDSNRQTIIEEFTAVLNELGGLI